MQHHHTSPSRHAYPVHHLRQSVHNFTRPLPVTLKLWGDALLANRAVHPYFIPGCEGLPSAPCVIGSLLPYSRVGLNLASVIMNGLQTILQPAEVVHLFSSRNLGLRWSSEHQIHRCSDLSPKHVGSRRALAGLLDRSTIRPQDQGQVAVPVPLVLAGKDSKLSSQSTVEPLHQPVALWMEWCGPSLDHPQPPTDLPENLRLEIPPLVTMELSRGTKAGEHLLYQLLSCGGCTLIWHCVRLWPLGEIIHGHQDVAVSGIGDWKGPKDVHPHSLHRSPHQILL